MSIKGLSEFARRGVKVVHRPEVLRCF